MCGLVYMNPLVGMAMCLKSFLFWYLLCLVIVKSLAPVIYIHTIYFVVTLAIFHLRAPPTLDVGDPSDAVGREDGGGCSEPQGSSGALFS